MLQRPSNPAGDSPPQLLALKWRHPCHCVCGREGIRLAVSNGGRNSDRKQLTGPDRSRVVSYGPVPLSGARCLRSERDSSPLTGRWRLHDEGSCRGRESNPHGSLGRAIRARTIQIGPRSRTLSYGPSSGQELGGREKGGQGLATLPGGTPGRPGRRRGQLAPDALFCCECRKAFARASAARALSSLVTLRRSSWS